MLRRPLIAALVLLAVYVALSLFNDPRGYLGTDTGGKVATLRVMEREHSLVPDVGYWAERWDPTGTLHPLYYTSHIDGKWVNVTTLPAVYAAYPLFRLAGYRGALLLPMLGSVFAALAARALAKRLGADERWQAATFWIVGFASPLTVYALDFWEHSLGVALIAWAVVLLFDAVFDEWRWWRALLAGLLLGVAATMRTEALVYAAASVGVTGLVLLYRRRVLAAVAVGLLTLAGVVLPVLANNALERATMGGTLRAERAAGAAIGGLSGSSAGGVPSRAREALTTTVAIEPSLDNRPLLVGLLLLALLAYAAWRGARAGPPAIATLFAAVLLYLGRFGQGLGFVSGLFAAAPIAVVALVHGFRPRARFFVAVALLAMPVVWAFQYQGGALPQWAGRYALPSMVALVAVGAVSLARLDRRVAIGFVMIGVAVTGFGLAWLSSRSHGVANTFVALDRRPEPVLVSRIAHLPREGGWFYDQKRWLVATSDALEVEAARVVRAAGFDEFGVVRIASTSKPASVVGSFRFAGRSKASFLGVPLEVLTYRAE